MTGEAFRKVETIEPYWEVRLDDAWLEVDMVVETETPTGQHRYQLHFIEPRPPTQPYNEGERVMSRPPREGL